MNSFLAGTGASMIGIAVYNTLNLWIPGDPWTYTKGAVIGTIGFAICVLSSLI